MNFFYVHLHRLLVRWQACVFSCVECAAVLAVLLESASWVEWVTGQELCGQT
eukprot:COSAG01_NODE_24538_length_775_cov_1.686391_3_plen_51_part_01